MTGKLISTNKRRLNPLLVNLLSVTVLGKIALGGRETFLKFRLQTIAEEVLGQTYGASGVLNHLNRFQAGELVEEPPAARVHKHGIALDLEQLQRRDLLVGREGMGGLAGKEFPDIFRRPVQNRTNIVVPSAPGIFQERRCLMLIKGNQLVPQPIQRGP